MNGDNVFDDQTSARSMHTRREINRLRRISVP